MTIFAEQRRRLLTASGSGAQVVNYTMLYDAGDECVDVTGGWEAFTNSAASGYITKNATNLVATSTKTTGTTNWLNGANTVNYLDLNHYYGVVAVLESGGGSSSQNSNNSYHFAQFRRSAIMSGKFSDPYTAVTISNPANTWRLPNTAVLTGKNAYYNNLSDLNRSSLLRPAIGTFAGFTTMYGFALVLQDDWQTLCEKAGLDPAAYADEAALCADADALRAIFYQPAVLRWMVKNCTGSFMAAFIASSVALGVYSISVNRGIVNQNEHWAKFLDLADAFRPVNDPNYTMLYYLGDECVDVTGGWSLNGYSYSHYGTSASTPNITYAMSSGTKMSDYLYFVCPGQYKLQGLGIVNPIDMSGYSVLGSYFEVTGSNAAYNMQVLIASSKTMRTGLGTPNAVQFFGAESTPGYKGLMLGDISAYDYDYIFAMSENADNRSAKMYSLFIAKPDDWQTLCLLAGVAAPASVTDLVADTEALTGIFNNESAAVFAAKNCTGEFMATCLTSPDAISVINASEYRDVVYASADWAKFLAVAEQATQEG